MKSPPKPFPYPLYVTRPFLPDLARYQERLASIWSDRWLTNKGRQHDALHDALRSFLGYDNLSLLNNATQGLCIALKALDIQGEVITTPFTFPATPHAISWNNATPVFADIDSRRLTIDPQSIESVISPRTEAILGVHVYGIPCDVEAIDQIAKRHGLKVIYDAAHVFGTRLNQTPIGQFGDVSVFSFHATKLFHTAEGGCAVSPSPALIKTIDLLKNFGIEDEENVSAPGVNGKLNELQAALGCCVLEEVQTELLSRQRVLSIYQARLASIAELELVRIPGEASNSLQYFVIRVPSRVTGISRDYLHNALRQLNIVTRKYFFPLCSTFPHYRNSLSVRIPLPKAESAASEVLALPFHGQLTDDEVHGICDAISYLMTK